jgi:hypothetical protein
MTDLHLLSESEYFAEIIEAVKASKAGDRLTLATMTFDVVEAPIQELLGALCAAAQRGAVVNFMTDAHSFMVDFDGKSTGPLLQSKGIDTSPLASFQAKYAALQALKDAGGHYAVVNKPATKTMGPIAGRSHIKTFIHNDMLYVGGCNLEYVNNADWMVRIHDSNGAAWLHDCLVGGMQTGNVGQSLDYQDRTHRLDSNTVLLLDSGARNQSVILRGALEIIDQAQEHLVITCQFFPNSITARHLAKAVRRGVNVQAFYNHPSKHPLPWRQVQRLVLLGERLRLPGSLFAHQMPADYPFLHAKIIASEQAAMIGSHNYVHLGVRLGTAEVALRSTDPVFAATLTQAVRQRLDVDLQK